MKKTKISAADVANILNEIAILLELKGENVFKSRAYQMAARTIENFEEDLKKTINWCS